jgi:hypothetical protein
MTPGSWLTRNVNKVTDDIILEIRRRELKVTLRPPKTKLKMISRSQKTIKARFVGEPSQKGGIRLDKYLMGPDDIDSFNDYTNIQIGFKSLECKFDSHTHAVPW